VKKNVVNIEKGNGVNGKKIGKMENGNEYVKVKFETKRKKKINKRFEKKREKKSLKKEEKKKKKVEVNNDV
jgi:hypothetical protein